MSFEKEIGFDLSALESWLVSQNLGVAGLSNIQSLTGGTQNILVYFENAGRSFVLRRPSLNPRARSHETIIREARILQALSDTPVPHPRFSALCTDENIICAAFYLMESVDGFTPTTGMPALHASDPVIQREMGFSLIDGAVALSAVDYRALGLEGFGKPENYLSRQVSRWRRQLEEYADFAEWPGPSSLVHLDALMEYLESEAPAGSPPSIIHGDFHFGNVMYRNDGPVLAAIIDWELSTIGDPLIDLAWIVATWRGSGGPELPVLKVEPWEGFPKADELIERYAIGSGRDLSAINWYIVLACFKLAVILEGSFARACAGKAPMETGELLHEAAIRLLQRGQYWISGKY